MPGLENPDILDSDRIPPSDIAAALTKAPFTYPDGASQVFTEDGRTSYVEDGRPTAGEWGVDAEGRFWSSWPPSYRAVYDVTWIVEPDGQVVGVRFTDIGTGSTSEGRYAASAAR
ncbi:MAG TPA: hypothetical protein VNP97_06005 [Microbacterium sp.]|nr:hypothetical protein [Microbacterium sp.]